jgi:predicted ATP-grasp superfamily ATP-dependent carboligase
MLNFSCDGANMKKLAEKLLAVEEQMESAHTKALQVKEKIDSKEHWNSNSQKTMAAFMDLLTQYHKDLIIGGDAPLPKGNQYLEELQEHLSYFYEEWDEYRELENII